MTILAYPILAVATVGDIIHPCSDILYTSDDNDDIDHYYGNYG